MNKIVIFPGPRNVLRRCKSILYGKLISTQEIKESEKHMNKQIWQILKYAQIHILEPKIKGLRDW